MIEIRKWIIIPNRKLRGNQQNDVAIIESARFMDIAMMCDRTHTMPRSGGLLDQDSLFVDLLHHLHICQAEKERLDQMKSPSVASIPTR